MNKLGRKQQEQNDSFIRVFKNIESIVGKKELDNKIDQTLNSIIKNIGNKKAGMAWSGGKDSMVLSFIMRDINMPYCLGMTDDLEYPEFLKFVTNNMPPDLIVYNSGQDLKWLSNNIHLLFPDTSSKAAIWFKAIQHSAQNKLFKDKNLDMLLTGRRKMDANFTGVEGMYINKATKVLRYSPLYDWSHEHILACIHYYNIPLAPFYSWDNGWVVGTGCWAARQWTGSIVNGWKQVWNIDSSVVIKASKYIKSAADYVRDMGI